MIESVLWAALGTLAVLCSLLAVALYKLWRGQRKLEQNLQNLTAQNQRSSDDVAGLCSAALAVDKRLAANESMMQEIILTVRNAVQPVYHEAEQEPLAEEPLEQSQDYGMAIDKIRQGADVDDLVRICGLTRDEAMLLVRLHGRR